MQLHSKGQQGLQQRLKFDDAYSASQDLNDTERQGSDGSFIGLADNSAQYVCPPQNKHSSGSQSFEQDDEVLSDLTLATKKVALLLDKAFDGVARTGMFYEGYGVDHLHSKLFPMHGTGNISDFQLVESKINKFFVNYEGYLSSHDFERADDTDLAKLAYYIRSCV